MRQFIKQALASTVGSLLSLTLFSVISLTLFTAIVGAIIQSATNDNSTVSVADKSILTIDLSRTIVDLDPGRTVQDAIEGRGVRTIELKAVIDAIDAAAQDKRIVAIYLDGTNSGSAGGTGFATLKEVRGALERFKATGKKIISYDIDMDKRSY